MIYIVIALALIGALTMAIKSQNENSGGDLTTEQTELLTAQMMAYAANGKNIVDQMLMSGTSPNALNFALPNETSFDISPHYNKVFHPEGGGLGYPPANPTVFTSGDDSPAPGWYIGRPANVEWTPSTAKDVLLVAYGISQSLCANINKKITGTTDIPAVSDLEERIFVDGYYSSSVNVDLTTTNCPDCEGYPALCVQDATPDYTYYSIISAQ